MIQPTLLFATLVSFVGAGIYFHIGLLLSRRAVVSPDARLAWTVFIIWWYALAATNSAGGALSLLGAIGVTDMALFLTFTQVNVLASCLALFGLVYYLLYLFTGNRKVFTPLMVFYIVYYVLLLYFYNWRIPLHVEVGKWTTDVVYQHTEIGPFFVFMLTLLVFPQIIGSFAYFTLAFRVKEITQKYRIVLISWSIIIAFLSSFMASLAGSSQYDWWQVASRLIGLAASVAMWMAYQPPQWIRQRFGILSLAEENA